MLNPRLDTAALARAFRAARPFPHVVIDELLEPAACRALVDEFPSFARASTIDENGRAGGKGTFEELRGLGPAFAGLDELLASDRFRTLLGAITGVGDLLHDPEYVGGGTHENQIGQELDPHVDFDLHPARPWRRKLNLLFYLNADWRPEWGGELELYEDPWRSQNPAHRIAPLFNRCVLFETSDRSWHGFRPIHAVRRSIAAYYYVEDREATHSHATIYVERELPEAASAESFHRLLARRRQHLRRLWQREDELTETLGREIERSLALVQRPTRAQLDAARSLLRHYDDELHAAYRREPRWRQAIRAFDPISAALLPDQLVGRSDGLSADGWVGPSLRLDLEVRMPMTRVILRGWIPPDLGAPQELAVQLVGAQPMRRSLPQGLFDVEVVQDRIAPGQRLHMTVSAERSFQPGGEDLRHLSWVLVGFTDG